MVQKKRQCGTCRFFIKSGKGVGTCSHPLRADKAMFQVRETELACRSSWGESYWEAADKRGDSTAANDQPMQPVLPEPSIQVQQLDDEVTSVSISGISRSRSLDDDVVDTQTNVDVGTPWEDDDDNERRSLIIQGSHQAVAGARKRHLERKKRWQPELIPFASEDEDPSPGAVNPGRMEDESAITHDAPNESPFPPDDFLEEERTADISDDTTGDDSLINERTSTRIAGAEIHTPRHFRFAQIRDEKQAPSSPASLQTTKDNPDQRLEWNSVPQVKAGLDLSDWQRTERNTGSGTQKMVAHTQPVASYNRPPRFVSSARAILADERQREARSQRQLLAPLPETAITPKRASVREPKPEQPVTGSRPVSKSTIRGSAAQDWYKTTPLRKHAFRKQEQTEVPVPPVERSSIGDLIYADSKRTDHRNKSEPSNPPQRRGNESFDDRRKRSVEELPDISSLYAEPSQRGPLYLTPDRVTQTRPESFKTAALPSMPRICETCSSYRPGKTPGQGTCINADAGPVGRTVQAKSLSCSRTFGDLWTPSSEMIWRSARPNEVGNTPRVENMLRRNRPAVRTSDASVLPDLNDLLD